MMCPSSARSGASTPRTEYQGWRVAHELDVGGHLVPRARGQDGERDAAGVEVDGVPHVPDVEGAALALPLGRRAVVPHRVVDDELVATLEQVDERDRPISADDLDRAVDLDHRQPPPGRGDRVALTGVRLLADQQLLAAACQVARSTTGGLPGRSLLALPAWSSWCPPLSRLVRLRAPWGRRQLRRPSVPRLIDPSASTPVGAACRSDAEHTTAYALEAANATGRTAARTGFG